MNINEAELFLKKLMKESEKFGFEDVQAVFSNSSRMSVDILEGEVSSYECSTGQTVRFKGKKNGQMGRASTTQFSASAIKFLLSEASENIDVLNDDDEDFIYCDPENPVMTYDATSENYNKNKYRKFADIGLDLEKRILAIDSSVEGIDYLSIGCGCGTQIIINSKGLYTKLSDDHLSIYAAARASCDGVVKSAGYYWYGSDIDEFNPADFTAELGKRLINKFGAKSVKSGSYRIILGNEAMISFVMAFFGNFSAYAMHKGISLLNGKEGSRIASEAFTLREDPSYEKAMYKVPFDDTGVLTTAKSFINKGVFETALYTLKSANIAGKKPTGNDFGGESFTNLIVEPGTMSFDELCNEVCNGLYITELSGLHAGVNAISGDFSLLCEGFRITEGKLGQAVEQITVSDNFYNVLNKISVVGNDIIAEPHGEGEFFCPSVIIDDISIAGDADE